MKNFSIILIAFFLGFGGILTYRYIKTPKQPTQTTIDTSQPTPAPTFALVPPSQTIAGTLATTTGHVEKLSRNVDGYHEASSGAQILLGESLATKEKSAASATITNTVNITMGENAELVFANLFPTDLVLQQKAGKIEYQVTKPMSLRVLHTLISIDSGDITVNVIDTDMSITVKTGEAKFALVDNENNTNVWTLKAGQRANIDDEASTVFLVQPR